MKLSKLWCRACIALRKSGDTLVDGATGLIDLPPNPGQKRAAIIVVAALLAAFVLVAPFVAIPLPPFAAFNPFLDAMILVTDLITALLLFAHFSISRSRALLVLAGGYLFAAFIVIPHALTFPGAFTPTGLLGADTQTTAWLYRFWHFGFPVALLLYAWLKEQKSAISVRSGIWWTVAVVITLVCALVLLATAGDSLLPPLFADGGKLSPAGIYGVEFDLLVNAAALGFLWTRRRSVLDLWLMVVACASVAEIARGTARFSLGFYDSRVLSLVTSTIVLIVLLEETTKLYGRIAQSNMLLRRERDNKLMNLEAVVAAISHELKQPLATILVRGGTASRFLEHAPPNLEKVRSALDQILSESRRATEIFNNIRELFNAAKGARVSINVNVLALETLRLLRDDLKEHGITTHTELMTEPRLIFGHKGQLQEVLINLIHNAIEAMDSIDDRSRIRILRLRTDNYDRDAVAITIEDTGPGIKSIKLEAIFDAFVTTKPQGTGLGLAICRMIVERHGGQLFASPSDEGGVFQLILPVDSSEEASKPDVQSDSNRIADRDALLHAK